MLYRVTLSRSARKAIEGLPAREAARVRAVVDLLSQNPRPPAARRLVGSADWRVRVGDLRVVYSIDDGVLLVLVLRVAHRREAYR